MTSPPDPPPSGASPLRIFAEARIGGEPIPSTATSELMLHTVTKALGAGATLVDSMGSTVPAAKPITKVLRGAGVSVYTLSDTLGGKGIKRGLGLALLALGGALVAISLITGSVPAWLTTIGFAILLGGLAYVALASGMLILAVVLATPVIPLGVWSMRDVASDMGVGGASTQIGLIVLLILTAMIMGVVTVPERSPGAAWAALPWRSALRKGAWLVGGVFLALVAAGALVVTGWTLYVLGSYQAAPGGLDWELIAWVLAAGISVILAAYGLRQARRLGGRPGLDPILPARDAAVAVEAAARMADERSTMAVRAAAPSHLKAAWLPVRPASARASDAARRVQEAVAVADRASVEADRATGELLTRLPTRELLPQLKNHRVAGVESSARRALREARQARKLAETRVHSPERLRAMAAASVRAATAVEQYATLLGDDPRARRAREAAKLTRESSVRVVAAASELSHSRASVVNRVEDAHQAAQALATSVEALRDVTGGEFISARAELVRGYAAQARAARVRMSPGSQDERLRRGRAAEWTWVFGATYLVIFLVGCAILLDRVEGLQALVELGAFPVIASFGVLGVLCMTAVLLMKEAREDLRPGR